MEAWPLQGLEHDLRPAMARATAAARPFALATVYDADGGPRGVGAQMVITDDESWGFVSGGCVESDITLHGRAVLRDMEPRHLVYGRGSRWSDISLPCGGRLDLLVEPVAPDDPAISALLDACRQRRTVRYQSDGQTRCCHVTATPGQWVINQTFAPAQRLITIGSDPIALAIAVMGARLGWHSILVWPGGPQATPGLGFEHCSRDPQTALANLLPDAQTAVAIATHDLDIDDAAIAAALASDAGYIGVLGARRRIPDRLQRLRGSGVSDDQARRLHMPIGLALGARTPWEIAVSVTGQIIAERQLCSHAA